jgi:pyrroline-5-carboxylate reductase
MIMKIAFIGGGNMGQAMLSAIIAKGLSQPKDISVSEINKERRDQLTKDFSVYTTDNSIEVIKKSDVVILAIKPQNLNEAMAKIGGKFLKGQLVLSIIAGKGIATLKNGLKHEAIVRAMPNTPAQIGYGMTVWTTTSGVTEQQKSQAASILGAMGKEMFVTDEDYIDIATAVSGSGPAYVFLFMESLIEAAQKIGMPQEKAYDLVLQLMTGSVKYVYKSGKPLSQLREMVTSPGGTTAAALKVFDDGKFTELIEDAVTAAYNRAKELGG